MIDNNQPTLRSLIKLLYASRFHSHLAEFTLSRWQQVASIASYLMHGTPLARTLRTALSCMH